MNNYNVIGLFCDDIREEKGGKTTLVGVHGDNVNITHMPGMFAKLGIYVRVHISRTFDIRDISLLLRFPNGDEANLGEFDPSIIEAERTKESDTPYIGLVMQGVMFQVSLIEPGPIKAFAKINGEENLAAVLNVRVKPSSPTASKPPASQSEPTSQPI